MNGKYTNRNYLDALEQKVLVFDEVMGTSRLKSASAEEHGDLFPCGQIPAGSLCGKMCKKWKL